MRRHQPLRGISLLLLVLTPVVVVSLAACAPESAPQPSEPAIASPSVPSSPAPTPTGTPGPPEGSAEALLPDFTSVVDGVWSATTSVKGRDYVDALVDAGFSKDAMQVTFDETSVNLPADSIQFSVRVGDECLVGQVGPSVPGPTARVLPGLADGECLMGETRSIDW
ncbi:DUF6993 domain-containing protein [Microbacterium oleivorans]|uniref:DUF6993 domain-containing protein n=1 Tax=Microbacterium oleivorans TaxID=273677 RepID=UPI00203FEDBA|nr:hypothetical protein [Microbacterium oleivorans]MCM3696774.1 hypothetical protein [Microbacterium oleivorans]